MAREAARAAAQGSPAPRRACARRAPRSRRPHHPLWLAHRHRGTRQSRAPHPQALGDRERRCAVWPTTASRRRSIRNWCGPTSSPHGCRPTPCIRVSWPRADPLPSPGIEDLAAAGIVLVLDQITDPHNVGAILRTAAAFAVAAIVTTARHSPEATGVLAKSASGALELVPIVSVQNLARGARCAEGARLSRRRPRRRRARRSCGAVNLRAPLALVLGAEGKGLRQLTRAQPAIGWPGSIFPARSKASTCRMPRRSRSTSPVARSRRRRKRRRTRSGW